MGARLLGMLTILVGLLPAALPAPAAAHHSFSAEYTSTTITLGGTVTKIEWLNPHARFYVDVKDEVGTVINWEFELASPNQLVRRGWTRNSLKVGDAVKVEAYPAKDGFHLASARTVNLADGRKVFAGSAGDGSPDR